MDIHRFFTQPIRWLETRNMVKNALFPSHADPDRSLDGVCLGIGASEGGDDPRRFRVDR